jgi:hypothetical protein
MREQHARIEQLYPRSGQLNREWQTTQPAADLDYIIHVLFIQGKGVLRRLCALAEQHHSRILYIVAMD